MVGAPGELEVFFRVSDREAGPKDAPALLLLHDNLFIRFASGQCYLPFEHLEPEADRCAVRSSEFGVLDAGQFALDTAAHRMARRIRSLMKQERSSHVSDYSQQWWPLTVVLVHGAFADASGWTGVIERLQKEGVQVTAPPNPLRGISIDSAYVASVFDQIPGPVLPSPTRTAAR